MSRNTAVRNEALTQCQCGSRNSNLSFLFFAFLIVNLNLSPAFVYSQSSSNIINSEVGFWRIEAESPDTRVLLRGDTLDIITPAGLSLWWNQQLHAPCTIYYRACVVMGGGNYDRLSDLNCFWMADHIVSGGRFVDSYRMKCYYLGYGGNYNTTTRFRRYTADTLAVTNPVHRPPILREYTDSAHLLIPNHWYAIRIEVTTEGSTLFYIDDELLIDYLDPEPLLTGWFAFRTTWSHIRLASFHIIQ